MAIPQTLRNGVLLRAGNRCEYCRLSQVGQEATFHVDHIVPVTDRVRCYFPVSLCAVEGGVAPGMIATILPSLMMWIGVLVLAATALARTAARCIAWSAC